MPTDAQPWVPLSTSTEATSLDSPPESLAVLAAPTAGLARVQRDLEGLMAIAVPGVGTISTFVTGAWAWCPNGPELPRAVMLAWGVSLPPAPGLGAIIDSVMETLEPTAAAPDPQWGAPAAGRMGESGWLADLDYPVERPGQVVVEAPSGTVITMWRRGWPIDIGGTITILAPGWDPRGRLPDVLAQAEVTRTRSISIPSAASDVLDHLQLLLVGGPGGRSMAPGTGQFAELAQLPADPVHPRAAGVFRLAPVVGHWWPPATERPGSRPPPPARPLPAGRTATAAHLPVAATEPVVEPGTTWSRTRGNARRTPRGRRRRSNPQPPSETRSRFGGPPPLTSPQGPDKARQVLPTLVAATLVPFAISFALKTAVAHGSLAPNAGPVVTVFALGLFLGPILTIAGIMNLAANPRRIVTGRWLLGIGVIGIELSLAFWAIAEQAGHKVF